MPIQTISYCLASLCGAGTAIDMEETRCNHHIIPCCHPQIMGLKATGVQCWWPLSSLSDRSEGSQCPRWGRQCGETKAHMKINLPVFKDVVTYQSWRWDLMVYHHVGCRDCTLLLYVIQSLQGYPRELVWSSGTDITLDNMLTILDEHYNNVKALDALNQELFQLWMVDKETILDLGVCLLRHLQVLAASFPDHFPPDHVAKLKWDCFYGRLPKWLKAMVAYLKASLQKRTYCD